MDMMEYSHNLEECKGFCENANGITDSFQKKPRLVDKIVTTVRAKCLKFNTTELDKELNRIGTNKLFLNIPSLS
jgi:hypothetical protein